jgi:hypothetical protein
MKRAFIRCFKRECSLFAIGFRLRFANLRLYRRWFSGILPLFVGATVLKRNFCEIRGVTS